MPDLCVIGAGCGRTGTNSLKEALELLYNAPCYHMLEVRKHTHFRLWIDAFAGKPDWDKIFFGFKCTVDFPASVCYEELLAKYPNAKVVLSVRTPDSWYQSVVATIWNPLGGEHYWAYWLIPSGRLFQRMCKSYRARVLGTREVPISDKDGIVRAFEAWNKKVMETVPPERLLLFKPTDGWGPLCKFLDMPEPSTPYPRVNDAAAFQQRWMARRRQAQVANIVFFAGLGGAIAVITKNIGKPYGVACSLLAATTLTFLVPKSMRGA